MFFALAAVITAGLYLQNPQRAEPPRPLAQLIDDLEVAIPRAHLSDAQKHELESDGSALKAAYQAKQNGQTIDRQQVVGAVKDLHRILDSGAFAPEDQKKLNADIAVLRKQ